MTIFGWDTSHFDDPPTVRDGIDFFTHKCAEGHHFYQDTEYQASLNTARNLGIPILGAYYVNHPGSVIDQVDWFLNLVNALTPWWKDVNWMFQIDAEKFPYMSRAPSVTEINAFGDLLQHRTGVPSNSIFAYAPTWLYGTEKLKALRYPLWASNYGSNPRVHYRVAYPGDESARWSPNNAVFLQYGSNTTIGNQTTCDANAYRGTLDALLQFIGAKPNPNPPDVGDDMNDAQSSQLFDCLTILTNMMNGNDEDFPLHDKDGKGNLAAFWTKVASQIPQDILNAAVAAALQDPATVAGIAKSVNDDAATRRADWK